jgi:quercetin dioxygenase-like cupin family protein
VERFAFGRAAAFIPEQELLEGVRITPLTAPLSERGTFQAAVFYLAAGGSIGQHRATVPQVLAVLEGSGEVSGMDGVRERIEAGEAVYWSEGEQHETRTDVGLTALVLEGAGIAPFRS